MVFEKMKDGSYLHNCHIVFRENDKAKYLFHKDSEDKSLTAFLNGYAIIPLEEYYRLKDERGDKGFDLIEEALKNIKEADKQLNT